MGNQAYFYIKSLGLCKAKLYSFSLNSAVCPATGFGLDHRQAKFYLCFHKNQLVFSRSIDTVVAVAHIDRAELVSHYAVLTITGQ